jgi:peptidoglycan/LPS O-acetylase OafA/YrhL
VHRLRGIDALRGVAAAVVFLCHAHHINGLELGPLSPFVAGGTNGVLLFFAISGYLLYRPFLTGDVNLPSYALRRVLRIWPGYLVALVGLTALTGSRVATEHPFEFVTLTQYLHAPLINTFLTPAWTLWVEVCFYAALPLVAWLLSLLPRRQRVTALLLIALGSVSISVVTVAFMASRPALLWAFVPGMILATLEADGRLNVGRRAAAAGVVLFAAGAYVHMPLIDVISAAGAFLLVGWFAGLKLSGRVAAAAAAAGALSYGVYLWHGDVLLWIAGQVGNAWISIGLAAGITLAMAAVCYLAVERPAIELARRVPRESVGALVGRSLRAFRATAPQIER